MEAVREASVLPRTQQTHKWLIDYDTTLADTFPKQIEKVNEQFGTTYTPDFFTQWRSENLIPADQARFMWGPEVFMSEEFQSSVPPVLGAIEGMHWLMEQGHQVMVVSDRPDALLDVTRAWLDKQGLAMVRLLFTRHKASLRTDTNGALTKRQVAYLYKLTHVVEDAPHHSTELAAKAYVQRIYLLDQPNNQSVKHEKIIRVPDWHGIIKHLIQGE